MGVADRPRVLVVDRAISTRDLIAELLGDTARELAWAPRDAALDKLRAAATAGQAFDVVILDGDAVTPALVREFSTVSGGARVVLIASGVEGVALANRCGATDVVSRPF